MIGNDDGVTKTEVEREILPDLPGILREALPHVGTKDGVSTVADFRVGIEQTKRRVGDAGAGRRPSKSWAHEIATAVTEGELPILVVGASGTSRDVDLVVVVFARALKRAPEFQSVVSFDPREALRSIVDRSRGMGRIWSAA